MPLMLKDWLTLGTGNPIDHPVQPPADKIFRGLCSIVRGIYARSSLRCQRAFFSTQIWITTTGQATMIDLQDLHRASHPNHCQRKVHFSRSEFHLSRRPAHDQEPSVPPRHASAFIGRNEDLVKRNLKGRQILISHVPACRPFFVSSDRVVHLLPKKERHKMRRQ